MLLIWILTPILGLNVINTTNINTYLCLNVININVNTYLDLNVLTVAGHCVTTGGQVSLTNKIFVINIKFYMKK